MLYVPLLSLVSWWMLLVLDVDETLSKTDNSLNRYKSYQIINECIDPLYKIDTGEIENELNKTQDVFSALWVCLMIVMGIMFVNALVLLMQICAFFYNKCCKKPRDSLNENYNYNAAEKQPIMHGGVDVYNLDAPPKQTYDINQVYQQ